MKQMVMMGIRNAFKSIPRLFVTLIILSIGLVVITVASLIGFDVLLFAKNTDVSFEAGNYLTVSHNNSFDMNSLDKKRIERIKGIKSVNEDYSLNIMFNDANCWAYMCDNLNDLSFVNFIGESRSGIVLPEMIMSDSTDEMRPAEDFMDSDGTVPISFYTEDSDEEKIIHIPVVGTFPICKDLRWAPNGFPKVFISSYYKEIFVSSSTNPFIYLIYADNSEFDQVISELESMDYSISGNDTSTDSLIQFLINVFTILGVGIIIVIILSIWITYRELSLSIKKREKTIGVLKAFGHTDSKIINMIVSELFVYIVLPIFPAFCIIVPIIRYCSYEFFNSIISYDGFSGLIRILVAEIISDIFIASISVIKPIILCKSQNVLDVLKT